MNAGKKLLSWLLPLGVVILQMIMTQVLTFIVSLLLPGMGDFPQTRPTLFACLVGITFSAGAFLTGWLAIQLGLLRIAAQIPARLLGTLLGAWLPLIAALLIYRTLAPGNPFFLVSVLGCILGFHLPSWIGRGGK
jgi:hypothetical protein